MKHVTLAVQVLRMDQDVRALTTMSRVYPFSAPESIDQPYVIVNSAHWDDRQLLAGAGGLYRSRIQVDCLAPTALVAGNLATAVGKALERRKTNYPAPLTDCYRDGLAYSDFNGNRSLARAVLGFYVEWLDIPNGAVPGGRWDENGYWIADPAP